MRFCALWLLPRNNTVFGATTPRNNSQVATGPHAATIFWVKHSTVFFLLASWDLKPTKIKASQQLGTRQVDSDLKENMGARQIHYPLQILNS